MLRSEPRKTLRLLIVEDNPGDVCLLEEVFRELNANISIQIAPDGVEGLKIARMAKADGSRRVDLILLDLNLPKISGHDVLAELKANPQTAKIPVIVFTSSRAEVDVQRAYASHANAYVKKPSSLEGLLKTAHDITEFWFKRAMLPV